MQSSSSTSLLLSSSQHQSSSKNWESSFGKLSSSYGFSGMVPSLPKKSSKSPKPSTSPLTLSVPSSQSSGGQPQKDYQTSFGQLSSTYGFGGGVPSLPSTVSKSPKSSVSYSRPTVVQPSQDKDYETSFGRLSSTYGFGGPVPTLPTRK